MMIIIINIMLVFLFLSYLFAINYTDYRPPDPARLPDSTRLDSTLLMIHSFKPFDAT